MCIFFTHSIPYSEIFVFEINHPSKTVDEIFPILYDKRCRKGTRPATRAELFLRKEVVAMITYTELFTLGMLIVAIVNLCLTHKKK